MRSRPVSRKHRLGHLALAGFVFATMCPRGAPAGTVEEQRARLPPPATCQDPVEGIWKSHDYDPRWGDWTVFTLEVHRVHRDGGTENELEGVILNDTWYGDETQSEPGPCRGQLRFKVSMDAKGTIVDGTIAFGGVGQWRMDEVVCGSWNGGYNLDQFTGTIDPEIQEFQSVNNDGGRAVNAPTVFRRVECFDGGPQDDAPFIEVAPPPFYPPQEEKAGCGCAP